MIFDVAIIGGGLAGLSLAIDLRERGHSVCVIEKGNYPRHKVCGEYISNESFAYLHHICPDLHLLNLPKINRFKLTSTGNHSYQTFLESGGFGISRYLLELKLFERARRLGAEFHLNSKCTEIKKRDEHFRLRHTKGELEAKTVCNCSGRYTSSLSENKKSKYIAVKYHIKTERDNSLIEIHNFPGGYCGISNIENNLSCLCYIAESDKLKQSEKSIKNLEEKYLYKNKELKKIFTEAKFLLDEPLTISGIDFRVKEAVKDDVFFLGDSSGTIAPITGNGMSNALRAACFLAEKLSDYFKGKLSFEQVKNQYAEMWNTNFKTRISLSRHFQRLSEYPFLCKTAMGVFHLMPPLAQSLIRMTHGGTFIKNDSR